MKQHKVPESNAAGDEGPGASGHPTDGGQEEDAANREQNSAQYIAQGGNVVQHLPGARCG
jgi:hypothetical protein